VDWSKALLEVIDVGSFSALWYWIVLAVAWSMTSHWVLGVPFDMVLRARRQSGPALHDLEDLVGINVRRLLGLARESGAWIVGSAAFLHTALALLAFWYGIELAQAVFLVLFPLSLVGALSLSTAARIANEAPEGEALCRLLLRHRMTTQGIGMAAIFVTAIYGMFQNFAGAGAL
jgi:hypothetical protein